MQNKVVIITGGFGALGRAVAAAAAAQGATVVRVDLAPAPEGASEMDLCGIDVADVEAAEGVVHEVVRRHGGVDVLINVAGGFVWQVLDRLGPQTWMRMYEMNLATTVTMTTAALPALLKRPGARIINIGAGSAAKAAAGMGAYAAAKSGVARLTESLAEELRSEAITVNAVLPGIIDTPANRAAMPHADPSTWVTPEAVADVILLLASPSAAHVTGALVPA